MLRKISSYIILILLSLVIIATCMVNLLNREVLSYTNTLQKLEKSNYYNIAYNNMIKRVEEYLEPSGLDKEVIEKTFTKEQLSKDINVTIKSIYEGSLEKSTTSDFKDELRNNIYDSLKKQNRTPNTKEKEMIDGFINTVEEIYMEQVFPTALREPMQTYVVKITGILSKAEPVLIVASVLLLLAIFLVNMKCKWSFLTHTGISLMISGLFLIASNIVVNNIFNLTNITIMTEQISKFIQNLSGIIFSSILPLGIVLACVGLILSLTGNLIRSRVIDRK